MFESTPFMAFATVAHPADCICRPGSHVYSMAAYRAILGTAARFTSAHHEEVGEGTNEPKSATPSGPGVAAPSAGAFWDLLLAINALGNFNPLLCNAWGMI
jgi:hypothetical protein